MLSESFSNNVDRISVSLLYFKNDKELQWYKLLHSRAVLAVACSAEASVTYFKNRPIYILNVLALIIVLSTVIGIW